MKIATNNDDVVIYDEHGNTVVMTTEEARNLGGQLVNPHPDYEIVHKCGLALKLSTGQTVHLAFTDEVPHFIEQVYRMYRDDDTFRYAALSEPVSFPVEPPGSGA